MPPANTRQNTSGAKRKLHPAMEAKKWKKGQPSPNPSGRPKRDVASEIAQAIFEGNTELISAAMLKTLKKGNPKVFSALADRAYGKSKEVIDLSGRIELVVDL